jgi:hypothetical protein
MSDRQKVLHAYLIAVFLGNDLCALPKFRSATMFDDPELAELAAMRLF